MNIIITGYYNKNNFGDDLFELIADKLFQSDKFKKKINNYEIIPITNLIEQCKNNNLPDCIILFGGETLNDFFLDKLISMYENNKITRKKSITKNNCLFKAFSVSCNQEYSVSLINKIQGNTQTSDVSSTTPSVFTKEEIEFLLITLREGTFKGSQLEIMYNAVVKLQQEYSKINKL